MWDTMRDFYLSVPHRVGGVSDDGRSSFLPVMTEDGEDTPLPWVDGHLQIRVWVKKHALLEACGSKIYSKVRERKWLHQHKVRFDTMMILIFSFGEKQ